MLDDFILDTTVWSEKFAFRTRSGEWLPEYRQGIVQKDFPLTVKRQEDALLLVEDIYKRHPSMHLEIVKVEEEIYVNSETGVIKKNLRELV